ncbi:helix-turn-helix domain-containing protein [Peterkaempfera bronchialis]|uniref:helix-turn-helix domain-containing protein n=1 Tax=Peterkaempfera bronchialis TaxID=2126346 RepID=UPI003C2F2F04
MHEKHPPPSPSTSPSSSDAVLDAGGLRALSHPVRLRLLGLLRQYGPSTATRLAEHLGLTSGATSYHLRRLAAAGFVEEDTARGSARERWWRSMHQTTRFDDMALAEQEPEAAQAYRQSVAAAHTLRTQRALGELRTMPRAWREAFDISDWALRLTPGEAAALHGELVAVIARYRRDSPEDVAGAPAEAQRVMLIAHLLPEPDAPASAEGAEGATGAEAP